MQASTASRMPRAMRTRPPSSFRRSESTTRMAHLPGDHSQVGWLPPSYAPYHCFENASSLLTGKNFDQTSVSGRALFTCLS